MSQKSYQLPTTKEWIHQEMEDMFKSLTDEEEKIKIRKIKERELRIKNKILDTGYE